MKKFKILHVEDDKSVGLMVKEMLKEYDYTDVTSVNEAIEEINSKNFDIIILDLKLRTEEDLRGNVSGMLFLEQLSKIKKKFKIIILSALSEKSKLAKSNYPNLIKGIVKKPFRKKELILMVKKILKK